MKSYPKIDVLGEVIKTRAYGEPPSAKLRIGDQHETGSYSVRCCPKCGKFYDKFGKYEHFTTTGVDKIICRWCVAGVEYVPKKPHAHKKHKTHSKRDLTGEKFSAWKVWGKAEKRNYLTYYKCECDCGTKGEVGKLELLTGHSTGCVKCRNFRYERTKV